MPTTDRVQTGDAEFKAGTRAMWALGDYDRFARETIWELGPVLVSATGIRPGLRVLDVAAGSGNVAVRAAATGADVVAADLTPENFEAGRREAAAQGVTVTWTEADAEDLPFDDGEFDVVTSLFGALFAPNHQAVADQMLRVCRPGGTIGMINFINAGVGGSFFEIVGRYAPPPPPDASSPVLWGDEDHVRRLFGDRVASLEMRRGSYVERAAGPREYVRLFQETFGPTIAIAAGLDGEHRAAFDRDLLEFATRWNTGPEGGPAEYRYDYLLVLGSKRAG